MNAILEGFNSKISVIKNLARGFKNMRDIKNIIYFCMGALSFLLLRIRLKLTHTNREYLKSNTTRSILLYIWKQSGEKTPIRILLAWKEFEDA